MFETDALEHQVKRRIGRAWLTTGGLEDLGDLRDDVSPNLVVLMFSRRVIPTFG
jgi:hypothetical protein